MRNPGLSERLPLAVKALGKNSVMCDTEGCECPAEYLFQSRVQVWAQCAVHARATAGGHKLRLPNRRRTLTLAAR
jgi:hypothetical protein